MSLKFENNWDLWYHHEKDNWNLNGYKKIYNITDVETFWRLYNNFDKIGNILYKQFFLMKENINPVWEDKNNKNGGCWSFKIQENHASELWEELSVLLVTNEILLKEYKNELVGLSIALKKNNYCIIKIWNSNSKNNSIKILNPNILEKWGLELIYIANVPDV